MHLPQPTRWRAFAATRYRPFQAIGIGQAFTASYASDALFVPLLLLLGAPAALVILVGAAPVAGAALQALAPQILRRMKGNLRGLTLMLALSDLPWETSRLIYPLAHDHVLKHRFRNDLWIIGRTPGMYMDDETGYFQLLLREN